MRSCIAKDRNPCTLLTSGEPFNPGSFKFPPPQCPQLLFGCIRVLHWLSRKVSTCLIFLLHHWLRLSTGSAWDGDPCVQNQTKIPSVAGIRRRDFNFPVSANFAGTMLHWQFFFYTGNLRLDHLVIDQSVYCNPMATSTYDDEDFVGKTKKLAQMCQPLYLGYQCLERYAAYVCCRWLRQLTEWL